jgi:hypothetical protein
MRLILSLALAISAIVGASAPASAAKAKATLTVSPTSAIQGNKVTVTLTAPAYTGQFWEIKYFVDGQWKEFCDGKSKTKKGVLKCVGLLPLEGNNSFQASCFWCGPSEIFSNKKVIKGKPAPGSPKNPVAKGKLLNVGDNTKKVGVLKLTSTNWDATSQYCSKFTNINIYVSSDNTNNDPCSVSSTFPGWFDPGYDAWINLPATKNPNYAKKLIAVSVTYKLTSSGSGNGYIPGMEFRQTNRIYVDSFDSTDYPGTDVPLGFYDTSETVIRNSAESRTAYFEVAKNITSGHLAIRDYDFGQFATKGLYQEAWMKTK